jgi:hypothetical protein
MNFGKKSLRAFATAGLFVSAGLWLCATGCQPFKPEPPHGSVASMTITNRSNAEIGSAIQSVFVSSGFQGGPSGPNQYTYERSGSRMDNLAYANYFFNEPVMIRVTVTLSSFTAGSTMVSCQAWLVESANDPVFEDSYQVRKLRKWPYEQLLKDIRKQLGE